MQWLCWVHPWEAERQRRRGGGQELDNSAGEEGRGRHAYGRRVGCWRSPVSLKRTHPRGKNLAWPLVKPSITVLAGGILHLSRMILGPLSFGLQIRIDVVCNQVFNDLAQRNVPKDSLVDCGDGALPCLKAHPTTTQNHPTFAKNPFGRKNLSCVMSKEVDSEWYPWGGGSQHPFFENPPTHLWNE